MYFILINDEKTISYSQIEELSYNYVKSISFLEFFSESYRENYKKKCVNFLKKYINKSREEIITDILKYINTWDNFSLSILYLHIICNLLIVSYIILFRSCTLS